MSPCACYIALTEVDRFFTLRKNHDNLVGVGRSRGAPADVGVKLKPNPYAFTLFPDLSRYHALRGNEFTDGLLPPMQGRQQPIGEQHY